MLALQSGQFSQTGKKQLVRNSNPPNVTVMDVTETVIERPYVKQKQFYSGKKKSHTLKSQLIVDQDTGQIICTF